MLKTCSRAGRKDNILDTCLPESSPLDGFWETCWTHAQTCSREHILSNSRATSAKDAKLPKTWQMLAATFGQFWPQPDQRSPDLAQTWSDLGQTWPTFCHGWANAEAGARGLLQTMLHRQFIRATFTPEVPSTWRGRAHDDHTIVTQGLQTSDARSRITTKRQGRLVGVLLGWPLCDPSPPRKDCVHPQSPMAWVARMYHKSSISVDLRKTWKIQTSLLVFLFVFVRCFCFFVYCFFV